MNRLTIIKIGGKVVEDHDNLMMFLNEFNKVSGYKILVHGGGPTATETAARLGINTELVDGRRITDESMLNVIVMVYAGLINKKIVAGLQSLGCNAMGLSGADLDLIRAKKRQHPEIDYGFVGDVEDVNTRELRLLLDEGVVPVIAPVTHDGNSQLLNTNADTVAAAMANELSNYYNVYLVYCFEKKGVLAEITNEESVISHLTYDDFLTLKDKGTVVSGMIPKLENGFNAKRNGTKEVIITNAQNISTGRGTRLVIDQ